MKVRIVLNNNFKGGGGGGGGITGRPFLLQQSRAKWGKLQRGGRGEAFTRLARSPCRTSISLHNILEVWNLRFGKISPIPCAVPCPALGSPESNRSFAPRKVSQKDFRDFVRASQATDTNINALCGCDEQPEFGMPKRQLASF